MNDIKALNAALDDAPELMSVKQFRHLMGIPLSTAYDWVRLGRVPSAKVGGSIFVSREGVRRLIQDALARV